MSGFDPDYHIPVNVELCPLEYQDEETEREKMERLGRMDEDLPDQDITSDWHHVPTCIPSYENPDMGTSAPAPVSSGILMNAASSLTGLFKSFYKN